MQRNNLRGTLGIRRIERMREKDLCNERKGVNEIIGENVLRWF